MDSYESASQNYHGSSGAKTKGTSYKHQESKKASPDSSRCLMMSPVKKLSALRLVSPLDTDDLEVASVLAEGGMVSPTKKSHGTMSTPIRPATVMTNVQRGNVQTTTPLLQQQQSFTIHQLAAQGELILIKQAVEQGADLDAIDEYGLSPLLWACANGQLITVKYLLEMSVSLEHVGHHGENSVLFACCYGYVEILTLLLQLNVNVNYADETESTGLMYAAYNNHVACVKLMLEHGADITLQNEDGHTAMDLAVGQGHKAVQQAIESYLLKLLEG